MDDFSPVSSQPFCTFDAEQEPDRARRVFDTHLKARQVDDETRLPIVAPRCHARRIARVVCGDLAVFRFAKPPKIAQHDGTVSKDDNGARNGDHVRRSRLFRLWTIFA